VVQPPEAANKRRSAAMQDIKARVRVYILDNFFIGDEEARFQDGDSFIQHHILDSTGFLELIGFLEEVFGVTVEDEEMIPENLDSLNNVEAYVRRKLMP
jgi:acyl carrier protein